VVTWPRGLGRYAGSSARPVPPDVARPNRQGTYRRLAAVKAAYDPSNVFTAHSQHPPRLVVTARSDGLILTGGS